MWKIVSIPSDRGVSVTLVPHLWEEGGSVYWPKKYVALLQKDPQSAPDREWQCHAKCVVKKANIPTYKEALLWEKLFTADTDGEGFIQSSAPVRKPVTTKCLVPVSPMRNPAPIVHSASQHRQPASLTYDNRQQKDQEANVNERVLAADLCTEIEGLRADVAKLIESVTSISAMQLESNRRQQAFHERIIALLSKVPAAEQLNDNDNTKLAHFDFPLRNLEELKKFNAELANDAFKTKMMKTAASIIGRDGEKRGAVVGKTLAEYVLSKELMTLLSWTGASRTAGVPRKFAFQSLIETTTFFRDAIQCADRKWNADSNMQLFANNLLKHSIKRKRLFDGKVLAASPNQISASQLPPVAVAQTNSQLAGMVQEIPHPNILEPFIEIIKVEPNTQ